MSKSISVLLCGFILSEYKQFKKKIHDLREIIHDTPLDYFVISETKHDNRLRRDRNKHEGGLIEFVRKGLTCKKLR